MKHKNNSPDPRWNVGKLGSSIYSKDRAYKFIATIFLVSLLVILFATTNMNPVQSCQNMQPVIKIIDESGGKRLAGTTIDTLQDSPFKNYVTAISQYLLPKISEMSQCKGELQGNSEVKIFFVYRPLIAAKIAPFQLERMQSGSTKYLDSPWVKLAIGSSPKPFVQAVFVWSERQFLLDQALLSGAEASSTEIPLPIDDKLFKKFVKDYTDSVLLSVSAEAKTAAQNSISKRLPPDILWLFRKAWQSTFIPFFIEVDNALASTIQLAEIEYTNLTTTLINQSLTSKNTEICYRSILNLNDVFTVHKYRINKLH